MSVEYVVDHPMVGSGLKGIRSKFEVLAQSDQDITIDLAQVEALDVSGLGALLYVAKRHRGKGLKVVLKNLLSQPRELLFSLKLNTVFEIEECSQYQPVTTPLVNEAPEKYFGKAVGSY